VAATANAEFFNGATVTATANIESTALRFNKSDDITTTTTPISVPTAAGTNYSFLKYLGIYVTVAAATTLTNLSIALIAALTTGFGLFGLGVASASYVQAGTGAAVMTDNATTDVTASGTAPNILATLSTRLSTTPFVYDATGGSANVTNQLVGKLCAVVLGVGNSYVGGGGAVFIGAASGTSGVVLAYDEA
jgi:hypothetical protein